MTLSPYVSIAYAQNRKVIGLACFSTNSGEQARFEALVRMPPAEILEAAGVTEVLLVTRLLTTATWPMCHFKDCLHHCCLSEQSPFCYPHTMELQKEQKL